MVMKVYSPDFKADAVALYLSDPSHTFEGVGKDVGMSRETLRNWVRAERARRGESGTTSTNTKDVPVSEATRQELEAEIAALRAELKTMCPPPGRRTRGCRAEEAPLPTAARHRTPHPRRPPSAIADLRNLALETRAGHGLPLPRRAAPPGRLTDKTT
ncbi:transposase [Streptomyces sp. V1I1]|uniref:transposase n=1 Tax=Streptomyces sp. V1I1 TaxID=3042272 RepID=UPI00358F0D5C